MVATVKLAALDGTRVSHNNDPVALVGDVIQLLVRVTDRDKSRGGSFRIVHPAIAGGGVTVTFEGRYKTGEAKKVFSKRKVAPDHYRGADQFTFTFTVATQSVLTAVDLVAVTECAVQPPDAPAMLRTVPDQRALDLEYPATLAVAPRLRFLVARGGNRGIAANAQNVVQDQLKVYAQLFFLDPEGVERALPDGFPVSARIGDIDAMRVDLTLLGKGHLAITALGSDVALRSRHLRLELGDDGDKVIHCELPGGTAGQTWGDVPAESDPTGTLPRRFFKFPKASLREINCEVTNDDGRWDGAEGTLALAKNNRPASLGTFASPVKIVIKPVWQFVKFTHFDRFYGHSDHGDADVAMPPVTLQGFRARPTAPGDAPEVRSNWWVDPTDDKKFVQCVPWIRQKLADGAAAAKPDASTELRFTLPTNTCVKSVSATERERVVATVEELKPGPDRLKFYDLPTLWQAQNYYGWLSDTAGEFGWYQDIATKPTAVGKPLVFNLDDIVLTGSDGKMLDTWTHDERLAIFANTFDDTTADCTKEGLYKADTAGNKPWFTEKPAAGAPEETWNYVRASVKWIRLIAAAGNLFDVFDLRSVAGSAHGADETVGARAAVRLVDATVALPPMRVFEQDPNPPNDWNLSVGAAPQPNRYLLDGPPPRVDRPSFSIQPYYDQHYMERFGVYDPGQSGAIGRLDLALIRCCGVADRATPGSEKEVAVHLYYVKTYLDFADVPASGEDAFRVAYQRNVLDRWNGIAPAHGRATLLPKDTTKRVQIPVVTFIQMTEEAQAHERVTIKAGAGARDWRQGLTGMGNTSDGNEADSGNTDGFVTAHEHGHERALPDEYNERWDGASFGQPSFRSTLPGDPFEMDGRTEEFQVMGAPMMNGNHHLHNRYFWQSAEWARRALGYPLKVKFNGCDAYEVPPHADPKRHYAFWPMVGVRDITLAANAPLTANRAKMNAYLYALGKDVFATRTLKDKEGGGATDYDGILLITLLLKVSPPSGDGASMKSLAQALARVGRKFGARKLNHKFYLTGTAAQGAPHEWTFTRCLVHFSPRLLIHSDDLPTREQFLDRVSAFGNFPECNDFADELGRYHAVPWNPVGPKRLAIDAVKNAIADPYQPIDGDWAVASAAIVAPPLSPPRPVEFATIDGLLNDLTALDLNATGGRENKLNDIISACDNFISANGGSPYEAAAVALRGRAVDGNNQNEAAWQLVQAYRQADGLEVERTKHETLVTEIENAHPPQFKLICVRDAVKSPVWTTTSTAKELRKKSSWIKTLDASIRTESRVVAAGTNLDAYFAKDDADFAARITALTTLATPAVAGNVATVRGDWNTASVVSGQSRPHRFQQVDLMLTETELAGAEKFDKRIKAMRTAIGHLEEAVKPTGNAPFVPAATALKGRLETALKENRVMEALRALEKRARDRAAKLQLEAASREVTLTAPDADAFEDALLEVFPSMLGVYKVAANITAADLQPIADALGITTPVIHAI